MKKILKITGIVIGVIVLLVIIVGFVGYSRMSSKAKNSYSQLGEKAPELKIGGLVFRDLNKNGKLDSYEDSRASLEDRVDDLVSQMTLEEKAGTMFITMIGMTPEGDPLISHFSQRIR